MDEKTLQSDFEINQAEIESWIEKKQLAERELKSLFKKQEKLKEKLIAIKAND